MKTIEVSDEDYDILMALSEELQTQDNNGQAFPYYWQPSSVKQVLDEYGEIVMFYDTSLAQSYSMERAIEYYNKDQWEEFCEFMNGDPSDVKDILYYCEDEWLDFLSDNCSDLVIYRETKERVCEDNFSLFKSDVSNFIKNNRHHLDEDPKTFARTIWRMDKMTQLMSILLRINNTVPDDKVDVEALKFKKSKLL